MISSREGGGDGWPFSSNGRQIAILFSSTQNIIVISSIVLPTISNAIICPLQADGGGSQREAWIEQVRTEKQLEV
jgi:hypothetical protein